MVLIGCLIFVHRALPLISLIFIALCGAYASQIKMASISRQLIKMWPFVACVFLLHALLSSQGTVTLRSLPRIGVNSGGVSAAVFFTSRLIAILAVGLTIFQKFEPQQYGRAVAQSLSKLPFGRAHAAKLALTISLALQFVPYLEQEYHRLGLALSARGAYQGGSRLQRLSRQRRLLIPLTLNAFRRADQVSLALEARGYDSRVIPTSLNGSAATLKETVAVLAFGAACIAITAWMNA